LTPSPSNRYTGPSVRDQYGTEIILVIGTYHATLTFLIKYDGIHDDLQELQNILELNVPRRHKNYN
jgi:hypothetical protein